MKEYKLWLEIEEHDTETDRYLTVTQGLGTALPQLMGSFTTISEAIEAAETLGARAVSQQADREPARPTPGPLGAAIHLHNLWLKDSSQGAQLNLSNLDLRQDGLSLINLTHANLSHTDMENAFLAGSRLGRANLSWACLRNAILRGADLTRANLFYASLDYSELTSARMDMADLSLASLRWANLTGASLAYSNLKGTDLSYANLTGVDFTGASLLGTKLMGAEMTSDDLARLDLLYTIGTPKVKGEST